jgi:hypothetical protein
MRSLHKVHQNGTGRRGRVDLTRHESSVIKLCMGGVGLHKKLPSKFNFTSQCLNRAKIKHFRNVLLYR